MSRTNKVYCIKIITQSISRYNPNPYRYIQLNDQLTPILSTSASLQKRRLVYFKTITSANKFLKQFTLELVNSTNYKFTIVECLDVTLSELIPLTTCYGEVYVPTNYNSTAPTSLTQNEIDMYTTKISQLCHLPIDDVQVFNTKQFLIFCEQYH